MNQLDDETKIESPEVIQQIVQVFTSVVFLVTALMFLSSSLPHQQVKHKVGQLND